MKKLFLLSQLVLLSVFSARAYDFEVDGINYNIKSDAPEEVEVAYLGRNAGSAPFYSGSVVIPERVTYEGILYSVTSIGNYAFYGCSGLTSVVIPEGVTSIGKSAFEGCSALASVSIPASMTTIGSRAFDKGRGLISIYYSGDIARWCSMERGTGWIFINFSIDDRYDGWDLYIDNTKVVDLVIPDGVTTIGDYAFVSCSGLRSVVIPESVTSIEGWAFARCSNLTSVFIFEGVTTIGAYTFGSCSNLTSVTIPSSMTHIAVEAFAGCYDLKSVYYGGDIVRWCGMEVDSWWIGDDRDRYDGWDLYIDNTKVVDLVIPESVTTIGDFAFVSCSGLRSVVIPEGVTSIGLGAFYNCTGLTSVVLPKMLGTIGAYAFHRCRGLRSVVIPTGVTHIGRNTFGNCTGLTSVTLPVSLKTLNTYVFGECDNLISVTSLATTPPRIVEYDYNGGYPESTDPVFSNYDATVYVPRGCKDAYQSAQEWGNFSKIEELSSSNPSDPGNPGGPGEPGEPGGTTANEESLAAAPFAYVQGRTIYLSDGLGEVEAFTSTGQRVYRGFDRSIVLPNPGVYILRVVADGRRSKVVVR